MYEQFQVIASTRVEVYHLEAQQIGANATTFDDDDNDDVRDDYEQAC